MNPQQPQQPLPSTHPSGPLPGTAPTPGVAQPAPANPAPTAQATLGQPVTSGQPAAPNGLMPAQSSADYNFILNPAKPEKPKLFGGSPKVPGGDAGGSKSSSTAIKLVAILGGIFLLMILLVVGMKILGVGSKGLDKKAMLAIAQDQTEILHISQTSIQNLVSDNTKNFAYTTQLSVQSQQSEFLAYLAKHGYKPGAKDQALKQSSAIDQQLTAAQQASTFDSTYQSVMQTQLQTYRSDLSAAYKAAPKSAKPLLTKYYDAAALLIKQLSPGN